MRKATLKVQVITRSVGAADSHGNPVITWSAPADHYAYRFAPNVSVENLSPGMDRVIDQPMLYTPPGFPAGPYDRVVVSGVTYEVDGSPNDWGTGMVLKLKNVEG